MAARIVFHMSPEFSHLAPTYRLAKQLRDRGHRVVYLQPPDFEAEVRDQGLEFAPIFEHVYPRRLFEALDAMTPDARVGATRALEVALFARYERGDAEPALRAIAPDLLLIDPLQAPMSFVAAKLGIRSALLSPFVPQGHDPGVPRMFTPAMPARGALGRLRVDLGWRWYQARRAVRRGVDRVWHRRRMYIASILGLDGRPRLEARGTGWIDDFAARCGVRALDRDTEIVAVPADVPEFALVPEELDFPRGGRRHRRYLGLGIDLERASTGQTWRRIDPSRPVVFCSLGSQPDLVRRAPGILAAVMEALARRPELEGVIVTGTPRWRAELAPPPGNVTLLQWARPLEILPRAALTITHGGLGSIKESLYFGAPMIVLPQCNDQYGNAARVAYHGYGRVLLDEPRPDALGAAIDALLADDLTRRRVAELAARLRDRDASDHAPGAIEAYLCG